jgi:hypothetical protein
MYADWFRLVFLLRRSKAVCRIGFSSQSGEFSSAISDPEMLSNSRSRGIASIRLVFCLDRQQIAIRRSPGRTRSLKPIKKKRNTSRPTPSPKHRQALPSSDRTPRAWKRALRPLLAISPRVRDRFVGRPTSYFLDRLRAWEIVRPRPPSDRACRY